MTKKKNVLFLCTGNSCRSQMAEGLLRHLDTEGEFEAHSAGMEPATQINPTAVEVMNEIGIDITEQKPKDINTYLGRDLISYIVTVCSNAENSCPRIWPGVLDNNRHYWPIADPSEMKVEGEEKKEAFRRTRDLLKENIEKWLADAK